MILSTEMQTVKELCALLWECADECSCIRVPNRLSVIILTSMKEIIHSHASFRFKMPLIVTHASLYSLNVRHCQWPTRRSAKRNKNGLDVGVSWHLHLLIRHSLARCVGGDERTELLRIGLKHSYLRHDDETSCDGLALSSVSHRRTT